MIKSERVIFNKEGRTFSAEYWSEDLYDYVNVTELMCDEYRSSYFVNETGESKNEMAENAIQELINRFPNV